jgi:hypothetical protein
MKAKPAAVFLAVALLQAASGRACADPIRTLVYRYAITMNNMSGMTGMGSGGNLSYSEALDTDGSRGEMVVQVQAATKDGGLVVDVHEQIDNQPHPTQSIRCAVYSDPNDVICDQNLHASAAETALLSYLGRYFYDPTRLDAANHWRIFEPLNNGTASVTTDLTVKSVTATKNDGQLLDISLHRVLKDGPYLSDTTGSLTYDPKMDIPTAGHLVTDIQTGGSFGGSVINFHLLQDSFAAAH